MRNLATRLTSLLAFAFTMTLLSLSFPVTARAQGPIQVVELEGSFPFSISAACLGERVSGTATFRSRSQFTADGSGALHRTFHETIWASAVGETSGIQYEGTQTRHQSSNNNGPTLQFSVTNTIHLVLTSPGSSDNFIADFVQHVTIDSNGQMTVFFTNLGGTCQG